MHHVGHDFHGGVTLSADVTPTVTCTARSWFFFSVCELRCWTSVISVSPYASQITSSRDMEAVTFKKLVKGHAYSVTAVDEVRKKGLQKWLLTTDMKGNVDQLQSSFSVITGLFVNLLKNFSSKTKLSMLHSNMEKRNKHTEPWNLTSLYSALAGTFILEFGACSSTALFWCLFCFAAPVGGLPRKYDQAGAHQEPLGWGGVDRCLERQVSMAPYTEVNKRTTFQCLFKEHLSCIFFCSQ